MYTEIIGLIADYGWPSIIILMAIFVFYKLGIRKVLDHFENRKNKNEVMFDAFDSLKYHPLFQNAQYRLHVEIPNLEICPTKPVRQGLFRDLIFIKTKVIYEACEQIAAMDMSAWSTDRWAAEMTKSMDKMLEEFMKRCRDEGMPEVVLAKFNKWHSLSVEMIYDYVGSLRGSNVYADNNLKTNTFFIIMNLLMITTIADAERSLKELNGDITGKQYKNQKIE